MIPVRYLSSLRMRMGRNAPPPQAFVEILAGIFFVTGTEEGSYFPDREFLITIPSPT
jgi:hypothetical protein